MTTREINLQFTGGGHARKCILHSSVSRAAGTGGTHEMKGVSWSGGVDPQTRRKTRRVVSQVTRRRERKKKNLRGCTSRILNARANVTHGRGLSIFPVQRRSPANHIDFIQLCGKYICRIAKGARNYATSC